MCCKFLLGKSKGKEYDTQKIKKDREGWNAFVRILNIMQLLEFKKPDVAISRVESLRKHVERTQKEHTVSSRILLILKILRELSKNDFNYSLVYKKQTELINQLSSDSNTRNRWRMNSHELIRFDIWFEAKAKDISYQEVFKKHIEAKKLEQL